MPNQLADTSSSEYLSHEAVAAMALMTPANLYYLNSIGKGPKRGKLGKRLIYRKADAQAWLEAAFQ